MSANRLAPFTGPSTRNLGTEIVPDGVRYTTWAPERKQIDVVIRSSKNDSERVLHLQKIEDGYFTGVDPAGRAGDLYTLTIDGRANLPDLASRYQPKGLSGPSMVIDPSSYTWQATKWKRPSWSGQVVYELHVGTFTKEGTFIAAIERLDYLVDLGVTVIELMPLAECTGERNWGYDGVLLFAPYHAYGSPDDLRALVDACHLRGLAVMLDVVYNHIGAVGDCTDAYSAHYSHPENTGSWGKSFNLDGENCAPVRHFLLQNIDYWLDEFRMDGFRLDATHAIHDKSEKHLMILASELIHSHGAFVTAEDDRNTCEILKPRSEGGWQLDAAWSDDFHHSLRVSQTHESHSYYARYDGSLEEIADILNHGWLFRGRAHPKTEQPRGTPCDHLPPEKFVCCISNHDQVGNRPFGERLHHSISQDAYRALSLFFCLVPYTPMLLMGQEWASDSPFLYFTDHPADFGRLVTEGRARDFQFDAKQHAHSIPDCQAESTFQQSKLNWDELDQPFHKSMVTLYREALHLRRELFGAKNPDRSTWKIDLQSNHLSMIYALTGGQFEVRFSLSRFDPKQLDPSTKILVRSTESRFGGSSDDSGPETIVLARVHV